MAHVEVVGGIVAEIKCEVADNVIEIGPDDIKHSDGDEDPFDVDDDELPHKHQHLDERREFKILRDAANVIKFNPSSDEKKRAIVKGKDGKGFKTKVNLKEDEKLVLNYTCNKDLVDAGKKKTLHVAEKEVNKPVDWSGKYRTIQGTSITKEASKIKVTNVPASYVSTSEYTQESCGKYRCTYCKFLTKCKKLIRVHIRRNHREVTTTYQCPFCPYKSKYPIKSHIISIHKSSNDIEWFRCNQCDYKSKLKSTLTTHLVSHLDPCQMMDRMSRCDLCPKMYKKRDALKRHILMIHEKHKIKKLNCTKCDFETFTRARMIEHEAVYHGDPATLPTLQCPKCSYKTKRKYCFEVHMKNRHPEKMLQCDKCGYQADNNGTLKLHMINHKEIKDEADLKYRCDKCEYKTYRPYSLQVHKLNHLKPEEISFFYCYHCKFKAKRKDNLKTHVLRHFKQNEVAFQCFVCDFRTKKRHVLTSHVNKHKHKIKLEENQPTKAVLPALKPVKNEVDSVKIEVSSDDTVEDTKPTERPKFEFISTNEKQEAKAE